MKNTKGLVDILLTNMYSPFAYDNDVIHHLIMALIPAAAEGQNYATDGLGFVFHQYKGRIPEETTAQVAEALNIAPYEDEIAKAFLKRSGSVIALLNLKHLSAGDEEAYIEAANEVHSERKNTKTGPVQWIMSLSADTNSAAYYQSMSAGKAYEVLQDKLRNITPGVPCSLPNGLVDRMAPTAGSKYAYSVPYLLYSTSDLLAFVKDTETGLDAGVPISQLTTSP